MSEGREVQCCRLLLHVGASIPNQRQSKHMTKEPFARATQHMIFEAKNHTDLQKTMPSPLTCSSSHRHTPHGRVHSCVCSNRSSSPSQRTPAAVYGSCPTTMPSNRSSSLSQRTPAAAHAACPQAAPKRVLQCSSSRWCVCLRTVEGQCWGVCVYAAMGLHTVLGGCGGRGHQNGSRAVGFARMGFYRGRAGGLSGLPGVENGVNCV